VKDNMKIIADAWKDEELWLRKRRGYFTASEIFKLMTHEQLCVMGWWRESWMDGDLDSMVEQKLTGAQPDFKDPVAVEWGKEEEDHNRQLFEKYSGIATSECHYFIGCDRWKYLATTLDGFSFVGSEWQGLARANMFDAPEYVSRAINRLPRDTRCLLEMKQTSDYGVKSWADGSSREPRGRDRKSKVILGKWTKQPPTMPVYYLSQVQTQMAIAGFDWNLAVVKGGASHMHAHSYRYDERWNDILDDINSRVATAAEKLRKELTNK
jgi:predicted phage-related endonuclease